MKKAATILGFLLVHLLSQGQGGTWTWMKGGNILGDPGNIGLQGVTNFANYPEGRYEAANWIDLNGNFWIFGGLDNAHLERNDLWKYDPVANTWTWVNGPLTEAGSGVYGTQGIPGPNNVPGARGWGVVTWTDKQGRLWMHSGYGYDAFGSREVIDDLWMYDIPSNEWTWMQGADAVGTLPNFGTLQVPSVNNTPGGRQEVNASWVKADSTLWTFGGMDANSSPYNDMWRYDVGTNMWTWMSGTQNNAWQSYGALGVAAPTNVPPGRGTYTRWQDANDNFYMLGGISDFGFTTTYNDVWKYDCTSNLWTWLAGDTMPNNLGLYDQTCNPGGGKEPGGRYEDRCAQTSACSDIFWFFGGWDDLNNTYGDLWNFNTVSYKWTWASGDSTVGGLGNYGSIGVPNPSNLPPSRGGDCLWVDHSGVLWMWGGFDLMTGKFSDMWQFVPDTACIHSAVVFVPTLTNSDSLVCAGDTAVLFLNGAHAVSITPAATSQIVADSGSILFFPIGPTTYTVLVSGFCTGVDTLRYTIGISQHIPVSLTRSICAHDSFEFYGRFISAVGVYVDTINNPNGCDSVVTMTVTPGAPVITALNQSICPGHTLTFNGQTISTAGIYTDTLTSVNGCDSIVVLTVSPGTPSVYNINQGICPAGTINFGGQIITFPGLYSDTLVASTGCDSIINLNVFEQFSIDTFLSQNICPGGSFVFNGQTITTSGVYQAFYVTASGCDSTVVLTVTVLTPSYFNQFPVVCSGDTFKYNGLNITSPGVYYDTVVSSLGCDSIFYTFTVNVFQSSVDSISQSICSGSSINFGGQIITTAGEYYDSLFTVNGCDSIIVLTVKVSQADTININKGICTGDTVIFNGVPITASGVYSDTFVSVSGCDSITTLTLNVAPKPVAGFSITPVPSNDSVPIGPISVTNLSINADSVLWLLNNQVISLIKDSLLPVTDTGAFCIRLVASSNSGCSDSSTQCIIVYGNAFVMPNAFTPNGDRLNDLFYPVLLNSNGSTVVSFKIYNRWGQLVYDDPSQGWDGKFKGEPQPEGVYTYVITVNAPYISNQAQGSGVPRSGQFMLIR